MVGEGGAKCPAPELGGELKKPWLGEGLWLGTKVRGWGEEGQGKVWALAAAELRKQPPSGGREAYSVPSSPQPRERLQAVLRAAGRRMTGSGGVQLLTLALQPGIHTSTQFSCPCLAFSAASPCPLNRHSLSTPLGPGPGWGRCTQQEFQQTLEQGAARERGPRH